MKNYNYSFFNFLKTLGPFFLDLIFPKFCLGCKREGTLLCEDCHSLLEILEYQYCLCEKNPLRLPFDAKKGKCYRCKNKKLDGLYFALPYRQQLVQKLIHSLKYSPYIKELSKTLAQIIIEHLFLSGKNKNEIWEGAILIPVPLEKNKLKLRGYNQSEQIGKELSKILKIPLLTDILIKIKKTPSQIELSKKEREKNLKGAFEITNPSLIKNKKVFLIDDVYTTGSTLEECANILKKNQVKSVWGITVAREE